MQNTLQFHAIHFLTKSTSALQIFWKPASLAHILNTIMPSSSEESLLEGYYDETDEEEECVREETSEDCDETENEDEVVPPDTEREILVDPMSLNHMAKPKFVSCSLPCSATSSPLWSYLTKKPHPAIQSFARQHSVAPLQFAHNRQKLGLFRSKSCGDGRSSQPSDEFDILSRRPAINISRPPNVKNSKNPEDVQAPRRKKEDEEFKCGALCFFLPAFYKKKPEVHPLRASKDENVKDNAIDDGEERRSVLSRIASLEKFECASWASSAIPDGIEEEFEGHVNAYFDLPLELIRGAGDDADSPVRTAFVFDGERKGGLKKSSWKTGPRKSCESLNRHVRFSTSAPMSYPPSPTSACITPRLMKAREEFNALLEAQNACINF